MGDFVAYVEARRESLWRTAWALTGDAGRADGLVQTALLKVWPRWQSITDKGDPEAYVKRVIYTTYIGRWHRRGRGEVPFADVPDGDGQPDDVDTAMARRRAGPPARLGPHRPDARVCVIGMPDLLMPVRPLNCQRGVAVELIDAHTGRSLMYMDAGYLR